MVFHSNFCIKLITDDPDREYSKTNHYILDSYTQVDQMDLVTQSSEKNKARGVGTKGGSRHDSLRIAL
jgi:hypothetical protein